MQPTTASRAADYPDKDYLNDAARDTGGGASSAVSWPAIFAGAVVAASVTLLLVALGSGLGFASVSTWPNRGASAGAITVSAIIWLVVMQWLSAGVGGYITGRLRTRWVGTHTHEVFFRDTAHGFITWAAATIVVASVMASAVSSLLGAGAEAVGKAGSVAAQGAAVVAQSAGVNAPAGDAGSGADAMGAARGANAAGTSAGTGAEGVSPYGLDTLFRPARPDAAGVNDDTRAREQATHIIVSAVANGNLPDADRAYLADLVAARTGIPPADAQRRVDDLVAQAKAAADKARQAADAARKASVETCLFTALSMLIGAFIASVAAAIGGQQRDLHP
jgi:hypothetical protein